MSLGGIDRNLVPGIRVADDTHTGISCQYAFEASGRFGSAICNDHLSRMLAVSNPNAAAVME
jgi:hypothetical protein